MNAQYAILTLFGRDRPGIVAQVTRILFETGCNIEDSSMTRLRSEFTVMLLLQLPAGLTIEVLATRIQGGEALRDLQVLIRPLPPEAMITTPKQPDRLWAISLVGADQPGIVYRVARILEEEGGNITDLQTQVIGSPVQPIYTMIIEAELTNDSDGLVTRLAGLAAELGVDISARPSDAFAL